MPAWCPGSAAICAAWPRSRPGEIHAHAGGATTAAAASKPAAVSPSHQDNPLRSRPDEPQQSGIPRPSSTRRCLSTPADRLVHLENSQVGGDVWPARAKVSGREDDYWRHRPACSTTISRKRRVTPWPHGARVLPIHVRRPRQPCPGDQSQADLVVQQCGADDLDVHGPPQRLVRGASGPAARVSCMVFCIFSSRNRRHQGDLSSSGSRMIAPRSPVWGVKAALLRRLTGLKDVESRLQNGCVSRSRSCCVDEHIRPRPDAPSVRTVVVSKTF